MSQAVMHGRTIAAEPRGKRLEVELDAVPARVAMGMQIVTGVDHTAYRAAVDHFPTLRAWSRRRR
jgi:hypothetical protein